MSKHDASEILRIMADFLRRLRDSDIDRLVSGKAHLTVTPSHRKTQVGPPPGDTNLSQTLDALYAALSREEGFSILGKRSLNKNELELLARLADLPVRRQDKMSDLSPTLPKESGNSGRQGTFAISRKLS